MSRFDATYTYDLTQADRDETRRLFRLAFPLTYDPNNPLRRAIERSQVPDYPDERPKHEELPRETVRKTPSEHLLNLFDQHELSEFATEKIAYKFKLLAGWITENTHEGPEQTVCLRHLLDSKHAAVRALITDDTPVKK